MMPMKKRHGRRLVEELAVKYPDTSNHALARMAYQQAPELFANVEAARTCVRTVRGANGTLKRPQAVCPPTKHTCYGMPKAIKTFDDWKPYQIDGPAVILVLSDIHVPFHDETALETAVKWGRSKGATHVLVNGDMADNHSISRWENDPRERDFGNEIRLVNEMWDYLRSEFPNSQHIWKLGNHEERYERYLMLKAAELLGVDAFQFTSIYKTAERGITVVRDSQPVNCGKLPVIHGHEYKFAISNPVNPARGLFLRAKESAMCGHHHMMSSHSEKSLGEHIHTTYSIGCLCQLRYRYAPINNHGHGVACVEVGADGSWSVDNRKIIRGKVWN